MTPQYPKAGPGDQVWLEVEGVVDRIVAGEEPLGGTLGFEPLLLAFSSSDDEAGVFGAIVLPQAARVMDVLQMQDFHCPAV